MCTNRWCLWISEHFMSNSECSPPRAARAGWETEAWEPREIPGVSPELLAVQSCLLACSLLLGGGTTWDMTPI